MVVQVCLRQSSAVEDKNELSYPVAIDLIVDSVENCQQGSRSSFLAKVQSVPQTKAKLLL